MQYLTNPRVSPSVDLFVPILLEWVGQLNHAYEESSPDHFKILLSHRPERYDKYENYFFDLVVQAG